MTGRTGRMREVIEREFRPERLEIEDQSARHAGHAGVLGSAGETHYAITMVSREFSGQSRLQRSRAVHAALAAEFSSGLHALTLTLGVPET